ncbi:MAG: homogentisate 1,2-dioxygenase [Ignavibacteria bacterium]|nr:homogentisate 1,2-dioxygenase [Ignavibacteria bacterium]
MAFYHKLGKIPQKRHTQFKQPDGSLYYEELFSTIGFDSILSNAYHINPPAKIDSIEKIIIDASPEEWEVGLRPYHFRTNDLKVESDFLSGRKPLLFNSDVVMSVCRPKAQADYFYKNAACDELIFVHEGEGTLESNFGFLNYKKGDYIVIPRSITYRLVHKTSSRLLIFEAAGHIKTPKRYRNEFGQLLEHSPYCERDIRVPEELFTSSEKGDYKVMIKKERKIYSVHYDFHPFDVAGYDGYYYPWIFNIDDFMPITGMIHMPPPVHQTFEAPGFVICSFVSRLLDYHPLSIPVPYSHSNVDSDEVLYYADGNFFSRKGIEYASISLHPGGLTHGPHPGTVETALGKLETAETAVMMDTFKPLKLTNFARELNDEDYYLSWKE